MKTSDRNSNRREFPTGRAAAALANGLAQKADAAPAEAAGERRNKQQGMAYRRLGKIDFTVSEIAMKAARPVFNGRRLGIEDLPERAKLIQDAVTGPLNTLEKPFCRYRGTRQWARQS